MAKGDGNCLVIVESPAKAKKIGKFLGPGFVVKACLGHVRDLPAKASDVPEKLKSESWSTLGVNVENGFEPLYVIPKEKKKIVKEIKDELKTATNLIIATDEDREGESIGWHLVQLLSPKVPVQRIVFSEITKEAIQHAMDTPRQLSENLVSAQETRRVLDRLYGYTLSPLLWKKIARGLSAGRVQSVAVRIIVGRELERLAFRSAKYWDLKADLKTDDDHEFPAQLAKVGGKPVAQGKDFEETTGRLKPDADVILLEESEAKELQNNLKSVPWHVSKIESREQERHPYPPFITSTLQQEANRKFGMTARATMQTAQRLYENGFITYMRTDSVHLSNEAIEATRGKVQEKYGDEYLSAEARRFTSKSKNAQEAHEAIRPAGTEMKTGEELGIKGEELKLYTLIWKRTMATQMAEAKLRFLAVTIEAGNAEFRASGKTVVFPGFFRAYVEGSDDPQASLDSQERHLPQLVEKQTLEAKEVVAVDHETKPPARYTEASLVRKMESEGIGRPSTYASIIGTIQDRGYVSKSGNQLVPSFTGLAVTRLLENNFPNLVDLNFTAKMEETLDEIAMGSSERLPYLKQFYAGEAGISELVKSKEESIDAQAAKQIVLEGIVPKVRVGRFGAYLEVENEGESVRASLPVDLAPGDLTNVMAEELIQQKIDGPQSLGTHPEANLEVYLKYGPFGPYVQLGGDEDTEEKPKRIGIPDTMDAKTIDFETALKLLSLPRELGKHPESGEPVLAGIGRYGPYVSHKRKFKSLGKDQSVLTVDLETAIDLIAKAAERQSSRVIKEIGPHPDDEKMISLCQGRYGPYVKHGRTNASLPKDKEAESMTLEEAVDLLATKKTTKKKR